MKDMTEVLEILTEHLTNERLNNIVQHDSTYQDILTRLDVSLTELQKTANPQALEEFNSIQNEQAAYYAKLSYQQGSKDFAQLFVSLLSRDL